MGHLKFQQSLGVQDEQLIFLEKELEVRKYTSNLRYTYLKFD